MKPRVKHFPYDASAVRVFALFDQERKAGDQMTYFIEQRHQAKTRYPAQGAVVVLFLHDPGHWPAFPPVAVIPYGFNT